MESEIGTCRECGTLDAGWPRDNHQDGCSLCDCRRETCAVCRPFVERAERLITVDEPKADGTCTVDLGDDNNGWSFESAAVAGHFACVLQAVLAKHLQDMAREASAGVRAKALEDAAEIASEHAGQQGDAAMYAEDEESETIHEAQQEAAFAIARKIQQIDPPAWIKPGVRVDYHAEIGGPVTESGRVVRTTPFRRCDHWSVMLYGMPGSVCVEALTPATDSEAGR